MLRGCQASPQLSLVDQVCCKLRCPHGLAADSRVVPYRASALPAAGLALAFTSDQALIWTYANSTASKILSLPLPPGLKGAEPLPFGEIVRNGPTNDFGVVAVAPSTGRIVFWENIDSAEARSLFAQRKQGIEGWVKLYSGERVTQLVDVDHAGYILVLSSGRLAQLTLRDAQGRPSVTTTVLNAPNGSSGSFFSLKGLLGGSIRKSVASVKARPSDTRGQMEVISATRNGSFQLWDLSWSGQQIFKREVDARQIILDEVQLGSPPETRGQQDVHILDFAILGRSNEPGITDTLVLVALSGRNMLDHFLLEVDIGESTATISRAIPLRSYQPAKLPAEAAGTLLLPDPGHTALVQFPDATVIASLVRPEESPEAQLFFDSGSTASAFQDCIYFRSDAHVRIVGYALEPSSRKSQTCTALVFIQDFGILQINVYAPPQGTEQESRSKVTALSKLMQATFFSTVPGTILDFDTKGRYSFSQDDVEQAAIHISAGILSSSFEHLEGNTLLLEDNLNRRALALRTLNKHLRSQFPDLSFSGRWQLLWHAEKLAACMKLWEWYQKSLRRQEKQPEQFPEKHVVIDLVKSAHEKYKKPVEPTASEHEQVINFFLHDIDTLEVVTPWAWNFFRIYYISPEAKKTLQSVMQRLYEANEVYIIVLETAFGFRKENIDFYGLDADSLDVDGILKAGYGHDKLSSNFWTSNHNMVTSLRAIVDAGNKYANDCYEKKQQEGVAQRIAQQNPRLVRLSCANHLERCRWGMEQTDPQKQSMGRKFREEWDINIRPKQIGHLSAIGLATEGMNLAERYSDMSTLVDLIWDETIFLEEAKLEEHSKMVETEINLKLGRIKDRVADCFKQYKDGFADAYFSKYIATNNAGELLKKAREEDRDFQASLTQYLSVSDAIPPRSRIAWINNIRGESAYGEAAADAQDAARQETNVWCKTAELSIAKLAAMAQQEADAETANEAGIQKDFRAHKSFQKKLGYELEVAGIQNQLYEYVFPTIKTAMDDESAVQLLMTEYGQGRLEERPALQHLLQQGFDQLVQHRVMDPYLLIDVLTLMLPDSAEDLTDPNTFNQFALALKVLAMINATSDDAIHPAVRKGLLGLVWKRILLQDDWTAIDSTQTLSQEGMAEYLAATVAGSTIRKMTGWIRDGKPSPHYFAKAHS